jgi:hypothetical protein
MNLKDETPNRLTIGHAMFYIAATVVGLSISRNYMSWTNSYLYLVDSYNKTFIFICRIWTWIVIFVPCVLMWNLTAFVLEWRRARQSRRFLQPGMVTGLAIAVTLGVLSIGRAAREFTRNRHYFVQYSHDVFEEFAQVGGLVIGTLWLTLLPSGLWRTRKASGDWCGRLTGVYWIALSISHYWLFPLAEAFG